MNIKLRFMRGSRVILSALSFKSALDHKLLEVLEKVQLLKRGSITDLAVILNTSISVAWKRLELLRKLKVAYTVLVNYSKIGLYQIAFFFDRHVPFKLLHIPYIRFYTLSLSPPGTFVVFSAPRHLWKYFTEMIIDRVGREPSKIWLVKRFLPYKHKIMKWVDSQNYTIFIDWNVLIKEILSRERKTVAWDLPDNLNDVKFDTIDLLIIRELQRDPFASFQEVTANATEIARKLKLGINVTYKKVLKHFRRDIIGHELIFNIVPSHVPLDYSNTVYSFISIHPKNGWSLAIYEVLSSHPFFVGCRVDCLGRVTGSLVLPQGEISNFNLFLENLRDLGVIEDWEVFVLDRVNRRAFTLPYDMYSPITGWRLPQLKSGSK
ncbi:MAG: hypothetical protein DRO14_03520 [Thermoprotei archaeon]|nr:MAG: hypothetical protein DRO14_03520 [Thermoprotei archaeon]